MRSNSDPHFHLAAHLFTYGTIIFVAIRLYYDWWLS